MNNNNPDYHIEQFWLHFKTSMQNFYDSFGGKLKPRNLEKWSMILNDLQHKKKYKKIERLIRDYMICYGIDVMRCGSTYHIGILGTNIKRWDKLTTQYKMTTNYNFENESSGENSGNKFLCSEQQCIYYGIGRSLFQSCLEICIALQKDGIDLSGLMEDIELVVIQQNILPLLQVYFITRKISIFDILLKNIKSFFIQELINEYGIELFKNIDIQTIRGKTIAKLLL